MGGCLQTTGPLLKKALYRVIAFILVTTLGGFLFSSVEQPNAKNKSKTKEELLDSLLREMQEKYNMSQVDFDNFTELSNQAYSLDGPEWGYFDGLRYAFETLTTIGYGTLAPHTTLGQALCILFSVLGIPITLLAFKSVGELISRGISAVISSIERKCFKRQPTHVEAKCTTVTCVLMIIMLLFGATMQIYIEEWPFFVGFYFWFITFTTIGYGDYVPGHPFNTQDHGKIKNVGLVTVNVAFYIVWTTLGLCVVSSVLNALAAFIEKRSAERGLRRKCCSCFSDRQQESEEMDTKEKEINPVNYNGNDKIEDESYYRATYV